MSSDAPEAVAVEAPAATASAASPADGNQDSSSPAIATESQLEEFARQSGEERQLNDQLRGVLAETALTGRIRYKWALLRPLVEFTMEQVLRNFERQTQVDVGPSAPAFPNESLSQTIDRFKRYMDKFSLAPWTLQRLCEVLLAPNKQYGRLHKLMLVRKPLSSPLPQTAMVALAIEKCLLVTTQVTESPDLPPPPKLSELGAVNENPPPVYSSTTSTANGPSMQRDDESANFTSTVLEVRGHPQVQHHGHSHSHGHSGTATEHIEEDHWPEAVGPPGAFGIAGLHHGHHHLLPHHHHHAAGEGGNGSPTAHAHGNAAAAGGASPPALARASGSPGSPGSPSSSAKAAAVRAGLAAAATGSPPSAQQQQQEQQEQQQEEVQAKDEEGVSTKPDNTEQGSGSEAEPGTAEDQSSMQQDSGTAEVKPSVPAQPAPEDVDMAVDQAAADAKPEPDGADTAAAVPGGPKDEATGMETD